MDGNNIENLFIAFDKLKRLLESKNLYLILQCLYLVADIANRRWWFLTKGKKDQYKEFRELIFGNEKSRENSLIAKYSQYPILADNLAYVVNFFKDLNSTEMQFVLENLTGARDSEALLIYFSLYRPQHYQRDTKDQKQKELIPLIEQFDQKIFDYEADFALNLLYSVLSDKAEDHLTLQENIAWQFWKIIKDQPEEIDHLSPWIDLLFELSYRKIVFTNLKLLLEDLPQEIKVERYQWLKKLVLNLAEYVSNPNCETVYLELDEMLEPFSRQIKEDEELQRVIKNIRESGKVSLY